MDAPTRIAEVRTTITRKEYAITPLASNTGDVVDFLRRNGVQRVGFNFYETPQSLTWVDHDGQDWWMELGHVLVTDKGSFQTLDSSNFTAQFEPW